MTDLSRCPCSGRVLTIAFAESVLLRRCLACGGQSWFVDEVEAERTVVDDRLRRSFVEQRNTGPRRPRRPRSTGVDLTRLIDLRDSAPSPVAAPEPTHEQLQSLVGALLAEKGLGSWRLSS